VLTSDHIARQSGSRRRGKRKHGDMIDSVLLANELEAMPDLATSDDYQELSLWNSTAKLTHAVYTQIDVMLEGDGLVSLWFHVRFQLILCCEVLIVPFQLMPFEAICALIAWPCRIKCPHTSWVLGILDKFSRQ
jgi:hypothetical protein